MQLQWFSLFTLQLMFIIGACAEKASLSPDVERSASPQDLPGQDDFTSFAPMEPDHFQGTEDTGLDMRPSEIEPTATDEEAEARFDFFRTQPHFRPAKISVEHLSEDRSKLAPGYYFIAPYWCGSVGPQIFDQEGVSVKSITSLVSFYVIANAQ